MARNDIAGEHLIFYSADRENHFLSLLGKLVAGKVRQDEGQFWAVCGFDNAKPLRVKFLYDVSGTYVLTTLVAGFLLMVPLVWALMRFWLFAP